MKDQKTIFYALIGGAGCVILIMIFLNINLILKKNSTEDAIENYDYTSLLYGNNTIHINSLSEDYKTKKNKFIKMVKPENEDKYLASVQKIATYFSKNDVKVLEVNPKLHIRDPATNFDILNDKEFRGITEYVLRVLVNGEEANIVKSINSIIKMPIHFYVENLSIQHPDHETKGNTDISFSSNWIKNE